MELASCVRSQGQWLVRPMLSELSYSPETKTATVYPARSSMSRSGRFTADCDQIVTVDAGNRLVALPRPDARGRLCLFRRVPLPRPDAALSLRTTRTLPTRTHNHVTAVNFHGTLHHPIR